MHQRKKLDTDQKGRKNNERWIMHQRQKFVTMFNLIGTLHIRSAWKEYD